MVNINRQKENEEKVTESIKGWHKLHSYGPSYRDISLETGISLGKVYQICHQLRDNGVIELEEGVARSIRMKGKKTTV